MRSIAIVLACLACGGQSENSTVASYSNGLFYVESGSCQVVDGGTCYQSTNYPSAYPNYDYCRATTTGDELISAVRFHTESCCDHLFIGSHRYDGSTSPHDVYVTHNTQITWRTDGSVNSGGWKICARPATTTTTTTCATGPKQCAHLASFSLLDSVVAFRNDQEARTCMNSGMAAVTRQVANTCTIKQVQGSIPCGTKCWPVLKPKILNVQSRCLEKKYPGLEKYNKCLLEHGCERRAAEECHDTDHGYSDSGGDPCYRYHGHEGWCGHYDTSYFHSHSMCCACGGGGWACPDQSAADVMKVQGAAYIMEGYLSNISFQLSQTAPESPIPMTHANQEALSLTLAFIGGALTAIMLGFIAMRRFKGTRSSAAEHLLA